MVSAIPAMPPVTSPAACSITMPNAVSEAPIRMA